MNPEEIIASADTLQIIDRICRRRFWDENDALECSAFVLEKLKDNDYARLRAYEGRSLVTTYLHTLANALSIDFQRAKYGRKRIPKIIAELGELAAVIYRWVCWEGFSLDDAYDLASVEGLFKGSYQDYLKQIAPVRKVPCPEQPYFTSLNNHPGDDGPERDFADHADNPFETLIARLDHDRRRVAIQVIRECTAALTAEDQLLVRLVYGSDHTVAKAARGLGLDPAKARKRIKTVLLDFKARLLAQGIGRL